MAWPERTAFSLVMIVLLFAVLANQITVIQGPGTWADPATFASSIARMLFYGVLPIWVLFRIIDFATLGPWRRREHRRNRIDARIVQGSK